MGERKSIRLERKQLDGISAMVEGGDADNDSEALRTALNAGLAELGYRNGERNDTTLRMASRRFADAFSLLGVMWLGMSFWLPIEFRIYAVGPFAASVACLAIDRGLQAHEPRVSRRITAILRGDKA